MVLGRIHDPKFANTVASGCLNEIRRCISCQNCSDSIFLWPVDAKMACAINAATGRELDLRYEPAAVALVGGALAAIERAEFLFKRGRDVCVLTPEDGIAPEIGPKRRLEHEKRLERLMVAINVCAKPVRILPCGIEVALPADKISLVTADTVIVAGNPEVANRI
jgi:pyruvate/2-oxoglutarate dehydrogenase complex dihydrolipoamide dehydrogenase (E3) component